MHGCSELLWLVSGPGTGKMHPPTCCTLPIRVSQMKEISLKADQRYSASVKICQDVKTMKKDYKYCQDDTCFVWTSRLQNSSAMCPSDIKWSWVTASQYLTQRQSAPGQRHFNSQELLVQTRGFTSASQPAYSMPIAGGRRWRTSPQRLKPARSNDKDSIEWRVFRVFSIFFALDLLSRVFFGWKKQESTTLLCKKQMQVAQRTWKA